jgi:class 3 adenylate cyclase
MIVVVADICSSSSIIEELQKRDALPNLRRLLGVLSEHIASKAKLLRMTIGNFTGDGWVFLFPEDIESVELFKFLEGLSSVYHEQYYCRVGKHLESSPKAIGLTFGIDYGPIWKMRLNGRAEYIGRAINVACRLQGSVREKRQPFIFHALVSMPAYERYFKMLPNLNAVVVSRRLKNIKDSKTNNFYRLQVFI